MTDLRRGDRVVYVREDRGRGGEAVATGVVVDLVPWSDGRTTGALLRLDGRGDQVFYADVGALRRLPYLRVAT